MWAMWAMWARLQCGLVYNVDLSINTVANQHTKSTKSDRDVARSFFFPIETNIIDRCSGFYLKTTGTRIVCKPYHIVRK